jgi:hypothetical protein
MGNVTNSRIFFFLAGGGCAVFQFLAKKYFLKVG